MIEIPEHRTHFAIQEGMSKQSNCMNISHTVYLITKYNDFIKIGGEIRVLNVNDTDNGIRRCPNYLLVRVMILRF